MISLGSIAMIHREISNINPVSIIRFPHVDFELIIFLSLSRFFILGKITPFKPGYYE